MSTPSYYTDPLPPVPLGYLDGVRGHLIGVARHSETSDWWVVYRREGELETAPMTNPPHGYVRAVPAAVPFPPGGYYRHAKGALYRLEGVARSAAPLGWLAVYRSIEHDRLNVRPLELFLTAGRFTYLGVELP